MDQERTRVRVRPIIRVFVSSTFSDLKLERDALAQQVWPKLEQMCLQEGFQFQAIDLRWGVPSEAGLHHRAMRICFEELRRSQEGSLEPNFLIMLGNRYGWRPLAENISADEFHALELVASELETAEGKPIDVLRRWYRLDENSIKSAYILQPRRTGAPHDPDKTDYSSADVWHAVESVLWQIINRAFPSSALRERFATSTSDNEPPSIVNFQASATEQEIWRGALSVPHAERHVRAFVRSISNRDEFLPLEVKDFFDLTEQGEFDEAARTAQEELIREIRTKLGEVPILPMPFTRLKRQDGNVVIDASTEEIQAFCDLVEDELKAIIKRQILEYWGPPGYDLPLSEVWESDREAREREIEQDDQLRFSLERGGEIFVGRQTELETILHYVEGDSVWPLIIHGESGCGKSALLARASQMISDLPLCRDCKPIVRFLGVTPRSSDIQLLLTSLCQELRPPNRSFFQTPTNIGGLIEEFHSYLTQYLASGGRPIVIVLDALDQLSDTDQGRELSWFPSLPLPAHVKIVVSCLSGRDPNDPAGKPFLALQGRRIPADCFLQLKALSREDAAALVFQQWLPSAGRTLSQDQRRTIERQLEFEPCRRPLYLKLLFEEARLWRSYNADVRLEAPTTPGDYVAALLKQFFDRLRSDVNHGAILVDRALGYLAAARRGLSETELLEVLFRDPDFRQVLVEASHERQYELPTVPPRIPVAVWSRLRADLAPYLAERAAPGGNVQSLYHRQVSEWVKSVFVEQREWNPYDRLAGYFDEEPFLLEKEVEPVDGSRRSAQPRPANLRKVDELPWLRLQNLDRVSLGSNAESIDLAGNSLAGLFQDALFLHAKVLAGSLGELLTEFEQCLRTLTERHRQYGILKLIDEALRRYSWELQAHPSLAAQQIYSFLRRSIGPPIGQPALEEFRGQFLARINDTQASWLKCVEGGEPPRMWKIARVGDTICRLVSGSNGCLYVGTGGGRVLQLTLDGAKLRVLAADQGICVGYGRPGAEDRMHYDYITCLSPLDDGMVFFAWANGDLVQLDPVAEVERKQGTTMLVDERELYSLHAEMREVPGEIVGPNPNSFRIICRDRGEVSEVVVDPEGRLTVGGDNGHLWQWHRETGLTTPVGAHLGRVSAIVRLSDGRVISAGDDGRIVSSDPANTPPAGWELSGLNIQSVGVTAEGFVVYVDGDGRVYETRPPAADTRPVDQLQHRVKHVGALPGGRIVSVSDEGDVFLTNLETMESVEWARRLGWSVKEVVTGEGGQFVVRTSNYSEPARLHYFRTSGERLEIHLDPELRLTCVAVLRDGNLCCGYQSGVVRWWTPETGFSKERHRHDSAVRQIVELGAGRIASCGEDGTIAVFQGPTKRFRTLRGYDPTSGRETAAVKATCLAASAAGDLLTGYQDGCVAAISPDLETFRILVRHRDEVMNLLLCGDRYLLSRDRMGSVFRSDLQVSQREPITWIDSSLLSWAAAPGGRVVCWSDKRIVARSILDNPFRTIAEHSAPVLWMAADGDGVVFSGSEDGTVLATDTKSGACTVVAQYAEGDHRHELVKQGNVALPNGRCLFCGPNNRVVATEWNEWNAVLRSLDDFEEPQLAVTSNREAIVKDSHGQFSVYQVDHGWCAIERLPYCDQVMTTLTREVVTIGSNNEIFGIHLRAGGEVSRQAPAWHSCHLELADGAILIDQEDGSVMLLSGDGSRAEPILYHDGVVKALMALPDGRAVSAGADGRIYLLDPATVGAELLADFQIEITDLLLSADGTLVVSDRSGRVQVIDPRTRTVRAIAQYADLVSVELTADDQIQTCGYGLQGFGSREFRVVVFDAATGVSRLRYEESYDSEIGGRIVRVATHDDEQLLVVREEGGDEELRLLRIHDRQSSQLGWFRKMRFLFRRNDGSVVSAGSCYDEDSEVYQGSFSCYGVVRLWPGTAGSRSRQRAVHRRLTHMVVAPDGTIVSAGDNGKIKTAGGYDHRGETLARHQGKVTCLVPLGESAVVSGGSDGQIQVTGTNRERMFRYAADRPIIDLFVSADQQRIYVKLESNELLILEIVGN